MLIIDLRGRIALVVGGLRGIGGATTEMLARTENKCDEVLDKLRIAMTPVLRK